MELENVKEKIQSACDSLYENKKHLIEEKAHERTIAAHIANYMQPLFKGWDVDPDYNREGNNRSAKKDIDGKIAYPDIVVHKHGPAGPNLIAIEVKGYWNNTNRGEDETKLIKLQQKHHYQFLFRLELGNNGVDIIDVEEKV